MQPLRPQGHLAPPRLTTMWPISPGRAAPEPGLAVDDQAAADPGAPEDADQGRELAPGAELELGFGRDLDVVADPHLGAELALQRLGEREAALPAGQVLGRGDDAGLLVGVAGRADPDPGQVLGRARPRASAASRIAAAIASATSAGPPLVGVGWRASPSTLPLASTTAVWILVPPRSIPPRSAALRAGLTAAARTRRSRSRR